MFTGLIEGVGAVLALEPLGGGMRLRIGVGTLPFDGVEIGVGYPSWPTRRATQTSMRSSAVAGATRMPPGVR